MRRNPIKSGFASPKKALCQLGTRGVSFFLAVSLFSFYFRPIKAQKGQEEAAGAGKWSSRGGGEAETRFGEVWGAPQSISGVPKSLSGMGKSESSEFRDGFMGGTRGLVQDPGGILGLGVLVGSLLPLLGGLAPKGG